MRIFVLAAAISILSGACASSARSDSSTAQSAGASPGSAVAQAEIIYADANDASSIVGAIDSGLFGEFRGRDRAGWEAGFRRNRAMLTQKRGAIAEASLTPADARVYRILQAKLEGFADPPSAAVSTPR